MRNPNSLPPTLALPIEADYAATCVLGLLTDPKSPDVAADAWKALARQNQALTTAPRAEIKRVLARQATIIEAAMLRFMAKAAAEPTPNRSEPLTRIALSCNRALLATLGAIHQVSEAEADARAISQTEDF